jgi:hypothetical protein
MSKLVRQGNQIIRILNQNDKQLFIIDCIKRTMPMWINKEDLIGFTECDEEELYDIMGMSKDRVLNGDEEKIARERFTMIAPILPFVKDIAKRNYMINEVANGISKQSIRKYLCLFLCYHIPIYLLLFYFFL